MNNIEMTIEDIMGDRFGRYSKYIIQERALPDVRDGLKPVQRRILYAMHVEGNHAYKPYRKSAKTVGIVIGNYHPHGDLSVYDAMVRLSQNWKMGSVLVDMQGNNGSIDDDPAAAMRYTEARLSKVAHLLLENIEEEVVPFVYNFDDMTTEPSVLPARFPNLLINGASGIAAGYATNIPPFNLNEIMKASIYRLKNPLCLDEDLFKIIQGPDFPTGGIVEGKEGIQSVLKTGKGRMVLRAKAEIFKEKNRQQIIITELPYEVVKSQLVRKIDDLRFSMQDDGLGDVMDVRDESDRNGLRIVIDCRKDADAESILNLFYKHTELQSYYNANMVAIVNQRPKRMGVLEILDAYLEFREEVVLKRSKFRYKKAEKRLHILEGLMKATSILDEVIDVIRKSKNRKDSYQNLMKKFNFTQVQSEAIVDLQLYRLSSTDINELKSEFSKLMDEIQALQEIIHHKQKRHEVMIQEFQEILEKHSQERRTEVRNEIRELEVDRLNLIPDERVVITLSESGYIKRSSMRSYSSSPDKVLGVHEEDRVILIEESSTIQHLLLFTNKGRFSNLLIHEIPESRWREEGTHLSHFMKLDPDERIVSGQIIEDFKDQDQFIYSFTKKGMIKKTSLLDYDVKRTAQLYWAMNLEEDDEMIYADLSFGNDEALVLSSLGQCIRLDLDSINPTGIRTKGVIGIRMHEEDFVVDAICLRDYEELIFISDRSQMKRIKVDDIPAHNRNTMGISVAKWVKSNPQHLKNVLAGHLDDYLYAYDDELIKLQYKEIPLMKLDSRFSNVLNNRTCDIIKKA